VVDPGVHAGLGDSRVDAVVDPASIVVVWRDTDGALRRHAAGCPSDCAVSPTDHTPALIFRECIAGLRSQRAKSFLPDFSSFDFLCFLLFQSVAGPQVDFTEFARF
jgi:hypothetical protein